MFLEQDTKKQKKKQLRMTSILLHLVTAANALSLAPLTNKPRADLSVLVDEIEALGVQPSCKIFEVDRIVHEYFLMPTRPFPCSNGALALPWLGTHGPCDLFAQVRKLGIAIR
jgi:hypothetical protein